MGLNQIVAGELSLTVIDRNNTYMGRTQMPSSARTDPIELADPLEQAPAELRLEGHTLQSADRTEPLNSFVIFSNECDNAGPCGMQVV